MSHQNDTSTHKNKIQQNIEIKRVTAWPSNDIVKLYKVGGWWKDRYDPKGIGRLIIGSFAFAVAINPATGSAIGMGRVVSDGVSDAYIQDVVVLDDWRGKGIGMAIIKKLLDFCLKQKLLWIGLIAEPGTKGFYIPLGFKTLPGEPMVYQPED